MKQTKDSGRDYSWNGQGSSVHQSWCTEGIPPDKLNQQNQPSNHLQYTLRSLNWHYRSVINIHNDVVIFGLSNEDHNANLINLMDVCQTEGLVLNSKKLEIQRKRVSFFSAECIAEGMYADPKKVQGIMEMAVPTDNKQLLK